MFQIEKNNIPDVFECYYRDEYGNTAHAKRTERNKFYIRIKPANRDVSFPVLHFELPIDGSERGVNFRMTFLDKKDHSDDPDIKEAISGAGELVNRWISLVSDTAILDFNPSEMHVIDPEQFARLKLESLTRYEELNNLGTAMASRNIRNI